MIEIDTLTEDDKFRPVIYTASHGAKETGRIKSWNKTYIFVWYHSGDTAAATKPEDLEFV